MSGARLLIHAVMVVAIALGALLGAQIYRLLGGG
jgi:hypothetical protein